MSCLEMCPQREILYLLWLCVKRLNTTYLISSSEDLQFLLEFGCLLGLFGHMLSVSLQFLLQSLQSVLRTAAVVIQVYTHSTVRTSAHSTAHSTTHSTTHSTVHSFYITIVQSYVTTMVIELYSLKDAVYQYNCFSVTSFKSHILLSTYYICVYNTTLTYILLCLFNV